MDVRRIIGRFGRRLLWCTLGSMFALGPGMASAQGCVRRSECYINDHCQNQVQAPISYNGWETKSWAYYCTGDHPDFFNSVNGYAYGNTCFDAAENSLAENDNFDGSFTNWCIGTQKSRDRSGLLPP